MRKFFLLQHTTTPYRTELFNKIYKEAMDKGIDFTFIYYRKMAGDRTWIFNPDIMTHKYKVLNSFELFIKKYPLYFSFKLMKSILKNPKTELILGISWNDFNIFIIVLLKRLGIIKNKIHFWSEANYMDKKGSIDDSKKYKLRKFVFDTADGKIIIPGEIAKITLKKYWGVDKPLVYLPNTVDINYNKISKKSLSENLINILLVARLDESIKGILNFLESIDINDLKKTKIYIAGDGKDHKLYDKYILDNGLSEYVMLLGNLDRDELLTYYKGCDLFLLPSFSDSNPLSIIEALFAGKAILISDRCGNKFEVLKSGVNGYCFNPFDKKDINQKFKDIVSRKDDLEIMGDESYKIAQKEFDLGNNVKRFLENI